MATQILINDDSGDVFYPIAVENFSTARESRNIHYNTITGYGSAVVLRPAAWRSGELRLWTDDYVKAFGAMEFFSAPATFNFQNDDLPYGLDMEFAVEGEARIEQDETKTAWIVTVGYRQVV
jgi:hypothetical protein